MSHHAGVSTMACIALYIGVNTTVRADFDIVQFHLTLYVLAFCKLDIFLVSYGCFNLYIIF